jgi:hypothetical protein
VVERYRATRACFKQKIGQGLSHAPAQPLPFRPLGQRLSNGIGQCLVGQGPRGRDGQSPCLSGSAPYKSSIFNRLTDDIETESVAVEAGGVLQIDADDAGLNLVSNSPRDVVANSVRWRCRCATLAD